jgi:trans-aconitate methyltransferase
MSRRDGFDTVAVRYARVRPGYPDELYEDLHELAGLRRESRIVEFGCGTGQATVELARRGYRITAVELGAHLAAIARAQLDPYPHARVVTADVDTWEHTGEPFELVLAATSFHWLDRATRLERSARLLVPDGQLAVVTTHHVAGNRDDAFFDDVQHLYDRHTRTTPGAHRLRRAPAIPIDTSALCEGGYFAGVRWRRYELDVTYTAAQYTDLLGSYSNHIALAEPVRDALLEDIARLIDTNYGGAVSKRYMIELQIAARA